MSFRDPQTWMMVFAGATLIGVILSHIHQRLTNQKIMGNHLHHVDIDLKEVKQKIDKLETNDTKMTEKISAIQSDISFLVGYHKGKDSKETK